MKSDNTHKEWLDQRYKEISEEIASLKREDAEKRAELGMVVCIECKHFIPDGRPSYSGVSDSDFRGLIKEKELYGGTGAGKCQLILDYKKRLSESAIGINEAAKKLEKALKILDDTKLFYPYVWRNCKKFERK